MAAFEIVALDEATPQLRAPGSADTYSAPRAVAIAPVSLTGAAATSSLSIAQTWNTTGTPTALDVNVTNTASNTLSLLMNLRASGSSRFSCDAFGNLVGSGSITISNSSFMDFNGKIAVKSTGSIGFGVGAVNAFGSILDVALHRDAANTLALRNGTNAQAFNVYNTYTDASNYERARIAFVSNEMRLGTEAAGTGSVRTLSIYLGATNTAQFSSGSTRLGIGHADVAFFGNAVYPQTSGSIDLGQVASVWNDFHQNGFHAMTEMTAPSAPAPNTVRIYAVDNGSGKTQLMALFAQGAAQQIAIEP